MNLVFELLDKNKHKNLLKNFDCGQKSMNEFLRQFAYKNQNLGLSKSWIVLEESQNLVGYFTLAFHSIEPKLIKDEKLPNYQVPTTLLARIAVNKVFQNQGLGKKILFLALKQALKMNEEGLPTYAVILDILDDNVLPFYQKLGLFRQLDDSGRRLFITIKDIRKIFQNSSK